MDRTSETLLIDWSAHTFVVPVKQLKADDMSRWTTSQAYMDVVGFILTLNEAVKNKKIRDTYHVSQTTEKMVELLDTVDKWVEEIPPIDQPQRFGNKAFRDLYNKLKQEAPTLLRAVVPLELESSIPELSTYLVESIGNDTGIDYGTGHELTFIAFLCCACKIGVFKDEDYPAIVLKIFDRYLYLVRKLQMTYRMEPAGSQGVWSLDDYQFLPFLWGSAQLYDHPRIRPKSFPEEDIYNSFYKDYLFLAAIKYINQVKTGPFAEHSNQLWGISGVPGWPKVNSGLIKMYKAEVLGKFPVIQHFLFGSVLTLDPMPTCSVASSFASASQLFAPSPNPPASRKSSSLTTSRLSLQPTLTGQAKGSLPDTPSRSPEPTSESSNTKCGGCL